MKERLFTRLHLYLTLENLLPWERTWSLGKQLE
jgi:hypothetical protein